MGLPALQSQMTVDIIRQLPTRHSKWASSIGKFRGSVVTIGHVYMLFRYDMLGAR